MLDGVRMQHTATLSALARALGVPLPAQLPPLPPATVIMIDL
jgi:hypothetical protein